MSFKIPDSALVGRGVKGRIFWFEGRKTFRLDAGAAGWEVDRETPSGVARTLDPLDASDMARIASVGAPPSGRANAGVG